jgi:two-component system, OmpR family, alkaline phosphatase synthesis response regulator PhoP
MNILVVEDSRFLRLANERALTNAGHNVISASDGEEGLRLAVERQPDLIILDMLLPKMSGPDVLRAIRANSDIRRTPVMVLTSLPQANEDRLLKEGATAYFEKSLLTIDKESAPFVAAVEKLLARAARANAAVASRESSLAT